MNSTRFVHSLAIFGAILILLVGSAFAEIRSNTTYSINFTKDKEAGKFRWSEPQYIKLTSDGLGWGRRGEEGLRDVWVETTEPIALGLSWRPTTIATIKATVEQPVIKPGYPGMLYVRYSADAKHWTTWQHLERTSPLDFSLPTQVFEGTVRVPYREKAKYEELRMAYSRREDVPWSSDEEALVKDIVSKNPRFFKKATPFIGYVQFLYEGQLPGGEPIKGMKFEIGWFLSGAHQSPKDESTRKGREVPWRFKAQ